MMQALVNRLKEFPMRIGVPTEIKNHEYRVGLTPASVRELTHHGHEVAVQAGAGRGIGCDDAAYQAAGCHASSRTRPRCSHGPR